jgi:hypothetical protein
MTDNIINTLQTELAKDLILFENKADNDALSQLDLVLISEVYQKVYQTLHEIKVTIK